MTEQIFRDLQAFYPETTLTIAFLAAIIADLIFRKSSKVVTIVTMAGLVVTGMLVLGQAGMHASIFSNMIAVDSFAFFFKLIIILSAVLIVVFSLSSVELNSPGRKLGEYYSLLLALTLGMILIQATNFF